jgi:hypothetical protein
MPEMIGEHELSLTVPTGWHQMVDGRTTDITEITVKAQIVGLLVSVPGRLIGRKLVNAANHATERAQFLTVFGDRAQSYPVTRITTEEEL